MNDKFYKAFKNTEALNQKPFNKTLKLNEDLVEAKENVLNETKFYRNINETMEEIKLNNGSDNCDCKCNCSCGLSQKSEQLLHLYAFDDEETPETNIDDSEELQKLRNKHIALEMIELAHRKHRFTTTTTTSPAPPTQAPSNLSQTTLFDVGIFLVVTALIGTLSIPYSWLTLKSRQSTSNSYLKNKYFGGTKIYPRLNNDDYDPLLLIYEWLHRFD